MFSMKRVLNSLFGILFIGMFFLQSCSKTTDLSGAESLASFVENEESVLAFGSVDLLSILNKADYASTPKFGPILEAVVKEYESSLNLKAGLFYALIPNKETGFDQAEVVCFLEVSNADSLAAKAMTQGYDVEEEGDMRYFRDHDLSLCLRNNIAAVLVKGGDFDEKVVLADIMDKASKGAENEDIKRMSALKGEIHLAYIMERTMNMSSGAKLEASKLKELKELQKDSYQEVTLYAEEGQVRIAMEGTFNEELKKRIPFKQDAQGSIRKKLGSGEPTLGFAMNVDTRKMQAFFEDFSPVNMNEMLASLGGPFQIMMMVAGGKISNVIDGQLGGVLYANGASDVGVTPNVNVYAQFGPNGEVIANMAASNVGEELKLQINKKDLFLSTSGKYDPDGKGIVIPTGCETFGKHGITFYANFEKVDMESFELENAEKILYLVKYVNAYFDADKGEILIKLKSDQPNALKQVSSFMLEEFASQISNISI